MTGSYSLLCARRGKEEGVNLSRSPFEFDHLTQRFRQLLNRLFQYHPHGTSRDLWQRLDLSAWKITYVVFVSSVLLVVGSQMCAEVFRMITKSLRGPFPLASCGIDQPDRAWLTWSYLWPKAPRLPSFVRSQLPRGGGRGWSIRASGSLLLQVLKPFTKEGSWVADCLTIGTYCHIARYTDTITADFYPHENSHACHNAQTA